MALQEKFELQGNWLFRYRSILPVVLLFAGVTVYLHVSLNSESFFEEGSLCQSFYGAFCLAISLAGFSIRVYTVGYTPADTSGRNTHKQVADSLNRTGIYSVVRHPLYLGNFLMWFGISFLTNSIWFILTFVLVYWIYYERIMFAEEEFLRKKFGAAYVNWANRTPAFLPNLKLFVKPSLSFSWKKVLKKEKNGFLALFLVFMVFNVVGEWVEGDTHYNKFLLVMCLISIVNYCVLEYFKKRTQILNEQGR